MRPRSLFAFVLGLTVFLVAQVASAAGVFKLKSTDVTEVSGACVGVYQVGQNFFTVPGLPYDVSGDTATVPATDPYTGMASACLTIVDSDQGVYLRPKPNADWQFRLSSAASGEPRRAEFGVKAGGAPIVAEFVTPGENGLDVIDSCTLSGRATFFRVSHE